MPITSVTGVSQEPSLPSIQQSKRSAFATLANRIIDFFKLKIFPLFKRLANFVTSPLRRRKVSVHKAPLPKEPKAVSKKAEELLPAPPKTSPVEEPKFLPPQMQPKSVSSIVSTAAVAEISKQNQQTPVKAAVSKIEAQAVQQTPQLASPMQPIPQTPAKVAAPPLKVTFTITAEIKKLTISLSAVLTKQETMLTKLKQLPWYSPLPDKKDIDELYNQYKLLRDEGKSLAGQLSYASPSFVKKFESLSGEANQGMTELQPMIKNGVGLGGLKKLLNGSSPEKETQRGFDLIKRYREAIREIINLPSTQHKA